MNERDQQVTAFLRVWVPDGHPVLLCVQRRVWGVSTGDDHVLSDTA